MEAAFHEDEKSNTLRVKPAGCAFCRNYQRSKGRQCRSRQKYVQMISHLTLFIVFSELYIISTTIDYTHQLCFLILYPFSLIPLHALLLFLLWLLILNLFSLIHLHALQYSLFLLRVAFSIFAPIQTHFLFNMPSFSITRSSLFQSLLVQKHVLTFLSLFFSAAYFHYS